MSRRYEDDGPDPRSWSRAKRATHLQEIGLPLWRDDPEISLYQRALVFWTETLDSRITAVIDRMTEDELSGLVAATAHKGGCGFRWIDRTPLGFEIGEGIEVVIDGDHGDWWVIDDWSCFGFPEWRSIFTPSILDTQVQPDYDTYLAGDHWSRMRAKAHAHYGSTCVLCNARQHLQVHHRTYNTLGRESVQDLIVLCDSCHSRFHQR